MKPIKVLFIGHDNLMRNLPEVDCDFLGVFGRSMGQANPEDRKSSLIDALRCFAKFIFKKYDLVVLPSALLSRVDETNSGVKAFLGRTLYALSYCPLICRWIRVLQKALFRGMQVAFVERFSQMTVHRNLFEFFSDAILFKTIAHRDYPERARLRVEPLPYWINIESYPEIKLVNFEERENDVFYTGTENCKARGISDALYARSIVSGVNFLWQKERVSLERFVELLSYSKIAWSPEGTNWQCWRHYESLYYGAIPLINAPREEIYHDLVHGETCLLYSSIEEAVSLIRDVSSGALQMKTTCEERRNFAIEKHSDASAGRCIIESFKKTRKNR